MIGQGKTRGQVAILDLDATTNQNAAAIQINESHCRDYIYQQLLFRYQEIRNISNSSGQQNLNLELIKSIAFPCPSLPEQIAIANLLSTWDTAIEKIERLIAAKEKRFKSLSAKYLFGAKKGEKSSTKRTRWFTVSEHWQILRIGKISKEVSVTNGPNSDIPVLSCTKYDGLVDSLAYFDKQIFSADTSKYKVVKKGQFAYATNHIEEGSIGYQDIYPVGLVSPMYTVFETNHLVDDSYLYKVLKTEVYRHIFQVNTSASVDRRGSLRWKEFAKLPIPLPPMEEQKQIAAALNTARKEIDLLKKQLQAYCKQKRGLMQKLLTGRWRVKVREN
jgi:type I restriction enzyme S subunit